MEFDFVCIAFAAGLGAGAWLWHRVGPILMGERWPDEPHRPFDWARDAREFGRPTEGHVRKVSSSRPTSSELSARANALGVNRWR